MAACYNGSMLHNQVVFGLLTIAIGVVSYSIYFRSMFRGKTRPDPYSWLIWGILAGITFFAQINEGGGPGTWATAFTAVVCMLIASVAYLRHQGRLKRIDEFSLLGAFIAIIAWQLTENPLWAVVLAVVVGVIGFVPTFQKALRDPDQETAMTYLLNGTKFGVAIFALQSLNPVTLLYPVALVCMNIALAATIALKRS